MDTVSKQTGTAGWSRLKLAKFSFFVFALFFVALEIIFRILFFTSNHNLHTSVGIQGAALRTPDKILVWKNQPFYVDYDHRFQFNEEGMKSQVGDVLIPEKQSNDFWVLLTGASAMEGMGSNKNGEWLDITGTEDYPYNETIGYYLQQILQAQMPAKKVKVFNAACSSYFIFQSYYRWKTLSKKINPDWVISMDGCNEPATLKENESVQDLQKADWDNSPQFHFPLNFIIGLTSHSAFINALKQKLFHIKQDYRLSSNRKNNYPVRQKWLHATAPPVQFAQSHKNILLAVDSFLNTLRQYDSVLTENNEKHLFLIQPHLCLRDTSNLSAEEMALSHYYRAAYNDSSKNTFMKLLHQAFSSNLQMHKNIVSMDVLHHWKESVFVDYCHFKKSVNQKIAVEISRYILSNGNATIFNN